MRVCVPLPFAQVEKLGQHNTLESYLNPHGAKPLLAAALLFKRRGVVSNFTIVIEITM